MSSAVSAGLTSMSFVDAVLPLCRTQREREPRGGVYLVWDQSGTPGARALWRGLDGAPRRALLADHDARPDGASPVVFDVSGAVHDKRLQRGLRTLAEYARFANALSLIDSPLELDALAAALRERAFAQLPERLVVVLRFFDTRTLPLLPRLLTPDQYAGFGSCAAGWYYLDREGCVRTLPRPAATVPFSGPLTFDDKQERMLIDDGVCDAVIDQLLDMRHPSLRDLNPPQQHALIDRWTTAARRLGIAEIVDVVLFCCTAHQHGDDFARRAPWCDKLAAYRSGTMRLDEALDHAA